MKTLTFVLLGSLLFICTTGARAQTQLTSPITLQTRSLQFQLSTDTGSYRIVDRRGGVVWASNPYQPRFGQVNCRADGTNRWADLNRCAVLTRRHSLEATFHPLPEHPDAWLRITVRALADDRSLEFAYQADPALNLQSLRLLDQALWVTDAEQGYMVVPVREGLLIPADSGLAFTHTFDTYAYEGCHMAMIGVVKQKAAALISWADPYVAAEVQSTLPRTEGIPGRQALSLSLVLRRTATSARVEFLGHGDCVSLGRAYRQAAQRAGWLVSWREKLKGHPERAKLFGAINFKLWSTLDRRMNEDSTQEEAVRVHWTFAEAAQVAEHLKNDLKLEKVLFLMGGWIRRGYDNQHPDILPAAPECGGNEGLADCARHVRQLGYLFGLHDNYQDMYKDAPSWDESFLNRNPDGSISKGGRWAGGRAYLTCSQKALELAKRPQNLEAVKALTQADAYFIDTTYAAGLMECFDPRHPLTRSDDLKWKQAISDYARAEFGIFGSECGREWALPHSDFFEGFTGVSGGYYHNAALMKEVGGVSVPLFEVVYRDGIAMYGKYGYDPAKAAEYVLHHVSIGRPLNYHSIPSHLYWNQSTPPPDAPATGPAIFTRADHGWAAGLHPLDRFVKNTYEILSPLNELTARSPLTQHQFLTPDRQARRTVFGSGVNTAEVTVNGSPQDIPCKSRLGGAVVLPQFGLLVESPTFVAFVAKSWNGIEYDSPVLFTLRSLDGKPLSRAASVRVFHGFGDARVRFRDKDLTVEREMTVKP